MLFFPPALKYSAEALLCLQRTEDDCTVTPHLQMQCTLKTLVVLRLLGSHLGNRTSIFFLAFVQFRKRKFQNTANYTSESKDNLTNTAWWLEETTICHLMCCVSQRLKNECTMQREKSLMSVNSPSLTEMPLKF